MLRRIVLCIPLAARCSSTRRRCPRRLRPQPGGGPSDHRRRPRRPPRAARAARSRSVDPYASADRAQGAQARRQRRRRRGRHGGRARRHRALQRRRRRWRLLRLLRRQDRQGAHPRRPRDRARGDAARRVHRPGDRRALPLHARAGHQRRLGRRARHPGHLDHRAEQVGHPVAGAGRSRRPPGSRAAASWSTRRSASRPRTTRSASRQFTLDQGALPARAARCPRSAARFSNPDLARDLPSRSASRARALLPRRSCPAEIVDAVRKPPTTEDTDAAGAARAS